MRFEALLDRHERGGQSRGEAAEMLGITERSLRRWRDRLRDAEPSGLIDRRIGEPAGDGRGDSARYSGFTVKHFHDQLQHRHSYKPG